MKTFKKRQSNRPKSERESIRSLLEDDEDAPIMEDIDSELLKPVGLRSNDEVKLSPNQRKYESGFSSVFHTKTDSQKKRSN